MHLKKHPFILGGTVLAIVVLVSLAVVAIGQRGVLVVVRNTGSQAMTDVHVTLSGKQLPLGDIPAGASASGRVIPGADSDVAISFTDGTGTKRTVRVDTYVTGGVNGRVEADVQDGQLKGSKTDLGVDIL